MLELYISQNKNTTSEAYGKYYPRVSYKQTMGIHEMAVHMAEHNTPFSEGTIEGILRDFVKCVREQTLNGNTVKVDNLAIFKVSVIGNGCRELYDADTDKTITASIGTIGKNDKTGPAVQSLKLLAQATGEYSRDELNKDGKLGWTDKTARVAPPLAHRRAVIARAVHRARVERRAAARAVSRVAAPIPEAVTTPAVATTVATTVTMASTRINRKGGDA